MPAERGLFIDVSRRMHPDVCRFVSEISYGGELHSLDECGQPGASPRTACPAPACAPSWSSTPATAATPREEAEVIAEQVALLDGGTVTARRRQQPSRSAMPA